MLNVIAELPLFVNIVQQRGRLEIFDSSTYLFYRFHSIYIHVDGAYNKSSFTCGCCSKRQYFFHYSLCLGRKANLT